MWLIFNADLFAAATRFPLIVTSMAASLLARSPTQYLDAAPS
jgi:hypothetical protein